MYRRIGAVCAGALLALAVFVVVLGQTVPFAGTATRGANLRSGPGTSYAVVGSLKAGDVVSVTKTNTDATWYQLDSGKWVAAFLVKPMASGAASGAVKLTPAATITATKVAATATPAPAATPTAAEVAAYLVAVGPASSDLRDAASKFARLFSNPLPGSNNWRVNLALQIAAVQVAHEQLAAVKPPASMVPIHSTMVAATAKCSEAAGLTADAFDNGDIGALNRATQLMKECAAGVVKASDMLDAVQK